MVTSIILTNSIFNTLKDISDRAYPYEACAFLVGKINGDTVIVRYADEVKNLDRSSVSFSVSSEDLLKVYENASSMNLDIVGIFHSHPYSKAYPSSKDLKYMSINQVPWVILSMLDYELRAFVCDEICLKELKVVIVD